MSRPSFCAASLTLLPSLFLCACPADDAGDGVDATGDTTGDTMGDGDGDPGDGDPGDGDGDPGDGDGDPGTPPTIDLFTVDGSDVPQIVGMAGAIEILVEASDADGTIAEVQILIDNQPWVSIPGPGPYVAEYIVGGESFNGFRDFTVVAVDDQGLEASAGPITLSVDVTGGVMVDAWDFDGGDDEFSTRLRVNPDGTELIAAGGQTINNQTYSRIDRVLGVGGWVDKTDLTVPIGAGIAALDNGEYLLCGWNQADGKSYLFRYDDIGTQIGSMGYDWTPQNIPLPDFEAPLKLETDAEGNVYAAGVYESMGMSADTSFLVRLAPDESVTWAHYGDDVALSDRFYALNLDVGETELVMAGYMGQSPAMLRYTLDGDFVAEAVANEQGVAWDAAIDDTGASLLGGYAVDPQANNEAWLTRYGANGQPQWSKIGGHAGEGSVIATEIDPFGESVVAFYEGCNGLADCDLYIRKFDDDGNELWEFGVNGGNFTSLFFIPQIGDIVTDRYGYIYVTAPYVRPNGDYDWWIVKLHP